MGAPALCPPHSRRSCTAPGGPALGWLAPLAEPIRLTCSNSSSALPALPVGLHALAQDPFVIVWFVCPTSCLGALGQAIAPAPAHWGRCRLRALRPRPRLLVRVSRVTSSLPLLPLPLRLLLRSSLLVLLRLPAGLLLLLWQLAAVLLLSLVSLRLLLLLRVGGFLLVLTSSLGAYPDLLQHVVYPASLRWGSRQPAALCPRPHSCVQADGGDLFQPLLLLSLLLRQHMLLLLLLRLP